MLSLLTIICGITWSCAYNIGDILSYNYTGSYRLGAITGNPAPAEYSMSVACTAHFQVMSVCASSVTMSLNLENPTVSIKDPYGMRRQESLEQLIGNEFYFNYHANGSISDVRYTETDSEETMTMKVGIAYALRTHFDVPHTETSVTRSVIDQIGKHREHVQWKKVGKIQQVSTSYETQDIIHYPQLNVPTDTFSIKSESLHTLAPQDRIVQRASGSTRMVFNKGYDLESAYARRNSGANSDGIILLCSSNYSMISLESTPGNLRAYRTKGRTNSYPGLNNKTVLNRVPYLSESYYTPIVPPSHRTMLTSLKRSESNLYDKGQCKKEKMKCWGPDIPVLSIGDGEKGMAIKASASAVLGANTTAKRFVAAAGATLDGIILGHTFRVVDAHFEYGQSSKNEFSVTVCRKRLAHKSFKSFACAWDDIQSLPSKNAKLTVANIKLPVWGVNIFFTVKGEIKLQTSYAVQLCNDYLFGKVLPNPSVTITVAVAVGYTVAQLGLDIDASVSDTVWAEGEVYGNGTRIMTIKNKYDGISLKLTGKAKFLGIGPENPLKNYTFNEGNDQTIFSKNKDY